jgi:pseudaminic acid synthase
MDGIHPSGHSGQAAKPDAPYDRLVTETGTGIPASIDIDGRRVGPSESVYVVAELSANHGHQLERALALVEAAAQAGADAVKLQTYTADTITLESDKDDFRITGTAWAGRTLHQLYREAYTPWEWHPELQEAARERGLALFSAPFDETAVDFLEELDMPAYKIASFELIDLPLIRRAAATGKPLVISTGMGTVAEIGEAVGEARKAGAGGVLLLKCTSAYPAEPKDMNLAAIPDLRKRFEAPVGLSDHSLDVAVPAAAVALGACLVEKHLTLSRDEPGPDSAFSLEPDEFAEMVNAVRVAEQAIGEARYGPTDGETKMRDFRPSLFVVEDVRAGEELTERNVRSIRPAAGLPPKHLDDVLGRAAAVDIERGTPLSWDLISAQ